MMDKGQAKNQQPETILTFDLTFLPRKKKTFDLTFLKLIIF